jgi:hypothetical protein
MTVSSVQFVLQTRNDRRTRCFFLLGFFLLGLLLLGLLVLDPLVLDLLLLGDYCHFLRVPGSNDTIRRHDAIPVFSNASWTDKES